RGFRQSAVGQEEAAAFALTTLGGNGCAATRATDGHYFVPVKERPRSLLPGPSKLTRLGRSSSTTSGARKRSSSLVLGGQRRATGVICGVTSESADFSPDHCFTPRSDTDENDYRPRARFVRPVWCDFSQDE